MIKKFENSINDNDDSFLKGQAIEDFLVSCACQNGFLYT